MAESRPLLTEYCRHGWHLVQIPHGHKGPTTANWNLREMCISEPEVAEWLDGNVGLAHAYSGTCAVDIDDLARASVWFAERKIDLAALLNAPDAVRIESRPGRAKLLYRLAKPLPSFNLKSFELRCAAANGKTVQDVLPPSIHPETKQPYTWLGNWRKLPPLPISIAKLWTEMAAPPKVERKARVVTSDPDAAKLRATVAAGSPDCGYDDWIKVGMALHYETSGKEYGLAIWNEWSAGGKKYKGIGDLEFHWRSFKRDHENPRTLASLRVETAATADEFADLTKVQPPTNVPSNPKREVATETIRTLTKNKMGKYIATISNVTKVLSIAEIAGYELAFDEFLDALVILQNETREWRPLNDNDYTALRVWLETVGNCEPISKDMMRDAVHLVAADQKMDSARMWLEGLKWDGTPRIARFCPDYFGTDDSPYAERVGTYLWTGLAGRVMNPGCQADMVPVFIGRQGVGKSRGVQAMSPAAEHFAELRIDDPDDTIARKMRGCLVAELAEMRGMRVADIERIKAFITRTHEHWVPKYKEFAITYPRRFLMIGTTNDEEFLPIDTEHRRWLPLFTKGADIAAIRDNRDQLWAEGAARYATEGVVWQGLDVLAQPAREGAVTTDIWTDSIDKWCRANGGEYVRLEDVLVQALGMDPRMISRPHELRAARALRDLGYVKINKRIGPRIVKVWELDPTA